MRFIPYTMAVLFCGSALYVQAAPPSIPPPPALERAERLLQDAQKERAPERSPDLWLAAVEKLNAAHAAYRHQVEEEEDDADDPEAIAAQQLAAEAEVDAELVLYTTRALGQRGAARSGAARRATESAP
jgi:hypothetical protein